MDRLARLTGATSGLAAARPPTLVIPVDQAEEFFAAESEAAAALEVLAAVMECDPDSVIVATIRSDGFARLRADPRLQNVPRLPFDLSPLAPSSFKNAIEGPARLADPATYHRSAADRPAPQGIGN